MKQFAQKAIPKPESFTGIQLNQLNEMRTKKLEDIVYADSLPIHHLEKEKLMDRLYQEYNTIRARIKLLNGEYDEY